MGYDRDKYRLKREKVLGVKQKSRLSFGLISVMVSTVIILGLGFSIIPGALDYLVTRNLDDVIYKLKSPGRWSDEILDSVSAIKGVENTSVDNNGKRLVITFDRRVISTDVILSVFRDQKIGAVQLNRMSHRQREANLREEKSLETL